MKLLPFISLFFIALLATSASAQIIKELPQKQELNNFTEVITKNAWSVNTATSEAISEHPTWPHDIWTDPNGNYYISFYYYSDSSKGYTSEYYDNYGNRLSSNCKIDLKLVEPYYGLNVTEENTTAPIIVPEENNTTTLEDRHIIIINESQDENMTVVINSSEIKNTVENSTNTVQNQGIIDSVKQYWFDFKNANLSNVTFNFFGDN